MLRPSRCRTAHGARFRKPCRIFSAKAFRVAGGTFIRALGGNGASDTPYQITDVYGLQGIGSAGMASKHFVLANDIDATGTANWNGGAGFVPIGAIGSSRFTGSLDGQSWTIAGLTIAPTETTPNVGLFGVIGSAGVVRYLNLTDINVSAGAGARAVGTLAGVNHGTITNIYVTGNVDGGDAAGAWVGGLVGVNGGFGRPGSITAAAVNVNVSSAGSNVVLGGLAAFNSRYSTILASIATGNVTSTAGVEGGHVVLGGLVGINRGWIAGDAAYGNVGSTTLANAEVGGLVGKNSGTIAFSLTALGTVQAGDNSVVGGLVGSNLVGGTIESSSVIRNVPGGPPGTVQGGDNSIVGGLVASNRGTISNSSATYTPPNPESPPAEATISVIGGAFSSVGGLVGSNLGGATISTSYADVNVTVTGGNSALAGGLVGNNSGTIESSAAFGSVQAGDNSIVGGLVATNQGLITGLLGDRRGQRRRVQFGRRPRRLQSPRRGH